MERQMTANQGDRIWHDAPPQVPLMCIVPRLQSNKQAIKM
jgi:hypothetical protein